MQQYWTTKQTVFRKLGKKEDDCIIASDLELDLKLELYQTIEESFLTLMRVLENYQEKLCALSQEENALGRFLKENGKHDKTKAGKAMTSAGKALSYSAQQRLTLRIPLVRLYQEVETFQYRAIVDTLHTVEKMEKARTAYRGSLMWMKDISQQLDPDTCKQMEKFRKVQSQVRKAKQRFDKMKLDTLQKVDLLSFSRCNLFSQALAAYQNSLLNVSKKIAQSSNSVASNTKGYQHYEFSALKELTETSKKLAEDTLSVQDEDKDTILYFEAEYHDELDDTQSKRKSTHDIDSKEKLIKENSCNEKDGKFISKSLNHYNVDDQDLLNLRNASTHDPIISEEHGDNSLNANEIASTNELNFLDDLKQSMEDTPFNNDSNLSDWQEIFGTSSKTFSSSNRTPETGDDSLLHFLPSQLLTTISNLKEEEINSESDKGNANTESNHRPIGSFFSANESESNKGITNEKSGMSAWFHLFADLDPLSNPDMIGEKKENIDDRNC